MYIYCIYIYMHIVYCIFIWRDSLHWGYWGLTYTLAMEYGHAAPASNIRAPRHTPWRPELSPGIAIAESQR